MPKINHVAPLLGMLITLSASQAIAQCPVCQQMPVTVPQATQVQTPQDHTTHQGSATGGAAMMEDRSRMMLQHLGPGDQYYDRRFIDMIIPHHQEAIVAGQDAINKAQHPELRQFAQKTVEQQKKDIQQLQTWRRQWYGQ